MGGFFVVPKDSQDHAHGTRPPQGGFAMRIPPFIAHPGYRLFVEKSSVAGDKKAERPLLPSTRPLNALRRGI